MQALLKPATDAISKFSNDNMLMTAKRFVFMALSYAKKLGSIPATYSPRETCPDSCRYKDNGCYAESGNTRLVHINEREDVPRWTWSELMLKIRGIMKGSLWRFNIGGDLPGIGDFIIVRMVRDLISANVGKKGFTFTHKPVLGPQWAINRSIIKEANEKGFTINLSGDNFAHADQLAELKIGPVVMVLPRKYIRKTKKKTNGLFAESLREYRERISQYPMKTPAGNKIVVCPATFLEGMTCAKCQLCANISRKSIPGFPAHGARFKTVDRVSE